MITLADRLLPDALWRRIQPLLPPPPSHARGGAPRTVPDRACTAAIVFMARTSTPWALLPVAEFGWGSVTTCWRRFAEWAHAGVFERLQELLLDELGQAGALDWSRVSVDSFSLRAVRGDHVGENPVDRAKPGSKLHLAAEGTGLPLRGEVLGVGGTAGVADQRGGHVRQRTDSPRQLRRSPYELNETGSVLVEVGRDQDRRGVR